jgi:MFS family permease
VLRAAAAGHLPALIALVVAAHAQAATSVLALCAVCGGALIPQVPAAMRSLWGMLVEDRERRETAYALVGIVFELGVVTGPALVAALVAAGSPTLAVIAPASIATGSALAFTATPASLRWRGMRHEAGPFGPLHARGMRTVFAVLAMFGAAMGVAQVAVPAFAEARGSTAAGGVLLAALSAGSLIGGLVYGARTWPGALPGRLVVVLVGVGAGFATLALAESPPVLAALLLLTGLLIAPTGVIGSTLLDTVAPVGTVTEAFAAMVIGIVAGTAAGNALGGTIVESASYETAVLAAGAIAAAGAALTLARRRTLTSYCGVARERAPGGISG